jgi:hypothetical protein
MLLTMLPECKLVALLRQIENSSHDAGGKGLAFVAKAAINIIEDISANYTAPSDIACLSDLLKEFAREGHGEALTYIRDGSPDCEICNALGRHLKLVG